MRLSARRGRLARHLGTRSRPSASAPSLIPPRPKPEPASSHERREECERLDVHSLRKASNDDTMLLGWFEDGGPFDHKLGIDVASDDHNYDERHENVAHPADETRHALSPQGLGPNDQSDSGCGWEEKNNGGNAQYEDSRGSRHVKQCRTLPTAAHAPLTLAHAFRSAVT